MRKYGDMKLPALREAVKQKKNEIEVLKVEMADLKDEIRIIEDEIFARLYAPKHRA